MSPSSRSASSRPSLSSSRSSPPTDVGELNKMPASMEDPSGESASTAPEDIALPSEGTTDTPSEAIKDTNSEIDAIFEQTASETESPMRPPSIPDYQYTGPRNYSSLTGRDSEDEVNGTPSPTPFGPTIRSATMNTAKQVAGENGMVFPNSVCESPTPSPFISHSRQSSVLASRGFRNGMFPEAPILSPFSSQKKKKKGSRSGFPKVMSSPSRKGGRMMEIPVAPSPDPSPLVLLHVTLLPLPAQGPASSVLANHLRKMISPTVVARGLLLPHPNDDYDALVDMIAENLGLDQETPPPFKKAPTYAEDECASHSEGSYISSSDEEMDSFCPNCSRRRLKPEFQRHDRPRRHRRPFRYNEKWYTINIFASNGLMRAGAWSRSWEEMERVDVEVTVTSGYEDIEPSRSLRPSSQRSEGKRSLQGSFNYKRRVPPAMVGVDTTTDEEMPKPRRPSVNRRRPSGPRSAVGSIRSRNASNYMKQEPLSELELPFGVDVKPKEIFEDEMDTDVPIFEAKKPSEGTFVPIWEDKDGKDKESPKPAERMRSEDAWTTDEEPTKNVENEDNRRLSGVTTDTAIHHTIRSSSSRETSMESEVPLAQRDESPIVQSADENHESRKVSNPHRLHPSSRRTSREIKPNDLNKAPSEATTSRPNSSRVPDNMAIVGLAISDDSDRILDDLEQDKENHDETVENKENLPISDDEVSSEEDEDEVEESTGRTERRSESRPSFPPEEEHSRDYRHRPAPRETKRETKRDFTTRTSGPSPMPSRASSPSISPEISPITSRANSPQPTRGNCKGGRRKSSRFNFDKSFDSHNSPRSHASPRSNGHSRMNSSSTGAASPPPESEFRGRSTSRSPRQSISPSPSPVREKSVPPDNLLSKFKVMIKPAIDNISSIPLPTLLLIAIPFAGLIAFSVNSYVQQRNLDYMVRSFMENQAQAQMNAFDAQNARLQQQLQQVTFQPPVIEVPNVQDVPNPESETPAVSGQELKPEERAELEWRRAQENGLHTESLVYGIPVGGKCVLPEDVVHALREATEEKMLRESNGEADETSSSEPVPTPVPEVVEEKPNDDEVPFHMLQPDVEIQEERPQTPPTPRMKPQQEHPGSPRQRNPPSPRHQPPSYQNQRERSRERKNVQQQPYDYYQQPPNAAEQYYDRDSRMGYDAGEIDVGKMGVRDGGLEEEWFGEVPEMMLPPPVREVGGGRQHIISDNAAEPEIGITEESQYETPTPYSTPQEEQQLQQTKSSTGQSDHQQDHTYPSGGQSRQASRPPSSSGRPASRHAQGSSRSGSRPPQASARSSSRSRPASRSASKPRPTSRSGAPTANIESVQEHEESEKQPDPVQSVHREEPKEEPEQQEVQKDAYVPLNLHTNKQKVQTQSQYQEHAQTEQKIQNEPVAITTAAQPEQEKEEPNYHIPENLIQDDYIYEDAEYHDAEEFDYEGFKGTLNDGWWEQERSKGEN